jgi:arabinofuranosyltransferase
VLAVGGDFMEFRFLDVVLPVGYVLVSVFLADVASRWRGKVVRAGVVTIAGAVVLASAHASVHFEDSAHQVLTWSVMSRQSTDAWVAIGKWFGRIAAPQESIATGTCGAIPYYSGLRCLDMRGLNDKYVARLAPDRSQPAGHHKVAPLSYVRERNITYIIFPTRAFPLGYGPPLGPDEFLVEIEDTEGDYLGGRNFLLLIRAAKDRNSLVQSLRRRGVRVITDEPPAADQALPGR